MAMTPPDLGEVTEILADIVSEDRRAGDIIGRMRSLLQRGQVSLQPVRVDECIDELLRLLHSDLVVRGIVVVNLATAELPPALADRVQLQQVLLNLIVNACDAMADNPPDERELTLRSGIVDDELRLCVQDRGTGLPEDVETVFQPFHTTKDHGLGMGLSICRSLVTAHRGRLWAEHRPGRGAAFHVALPLAPEAERGAVGGDQSSSTSKPSSSCASSSRAEGSAGSSSV
jgi:signal transduction histidine kinase